MKNKKTDMKNRFADTGKSYAGYFLRFVFCLVLTAAASLAQAQNRNQVSGKVTDKAGEPLIGATVVVVGTTTGATTGADGRFTIGVPAGGELKISYIGYVEQTVKVSAQSVLDIVLEEDSQMLKDVVVIGYGTMEKKSVTSSISSIKGDDLVAGMGGSTIATALQGKIPGLTISGSASPNSSNDFQLRGVASVNASKGPLVIIDGIPGGDMRALNQEDIESVDVLKDASAGAIYGTRAAGGVILVTTKQARQGRVTARYTGEFSVEAIRKTPDLLSSSEYVEYGLGEDYGHDTDWYKELTNELPFSQRHSVSISGGSNVAQVYTSFMAQNQKGIVIGDNRKDYSGRVNAKFNLFDGVVEIRTNAQFREAERDNRNSSGIFKMAFGLNPDHSAPRPRQSVELQRRRQRHLGNELQPRGRHHAAHEQRQGPVAAGRCDRENQPDERSFIAGYRGYRQTPVSAVHLRFARPQGVDRQQPPRRSVAQVQQGQPGLDRSLCQLPQGFPRGPYARRGCRL